jgi:hypothetical protein
MKERMEGVKESKLHPSSPLVGILNPIHEEEPS